MSQFVPVWALGDARRPFSLRAATCMAEKSLNYHKLTPGAYPIRFLPTRPTRPLRVFGKFAGQNARRGKYHPSNPYLVLTRHKTSYSAFL